MLIFFLWPYFFYWLHRVLRPLGITFLCLTMLGYSNRKVRYIGDWVLVKKTVYLQKQIHIQMLSNVVLEFIILKLNDVSINLGNFYYERFHF